MRYGIEVVVDLKNCDISPDMPRIQIKQYMEELCELIDMERCDLHFWDDQGVAEDDKQTNSKTKGTSAVQFILTSNITIHTLEDLKEIYVNIFSCKGFNEQKAAFFTRDFFGAEFQKYSPTVIYRGAESSG